jgi:hypothetical protein
LTPKKINARTIELRSADFQFQRRTIVSIGCKARAWSTAQTVVDGLPPVLILSRTNASGLHLSRPSPEAPAGGLPQSKARRFHPRDTDHGASLYAASFANRFPAPCAG